MVGEIITISTLFSSCSHIPSSVRNPGFVDWYLILRVDEDSEIDVIRRGYRQLALQVHPDKNRNPKAETAFKLISEAYECLSDKARRTAFDSDRRSNYCGECHRKHLQRSNTNAHKNQSRRSKFLRALREVQNRFKDECQVIESCLLRANEAKTPGMNSPVFDPSDHRLNSPDYPHFRAPVQEKHLRDDYWHCSRSKFDNWKSRFESSPVYELRSERRKSGFRF